MENRASYFLKSLEEVFGEPVEQLFLPSEAMLQLNPSDRKYGDRTRILQNH